MKIVRKIVNGISVLIIVFAVIILLSVVFTKKGEAPNVFGYSVFRVLTGSMEPSIKVDSMIIVKRTSLDKVKKNDIISFYSSDPNLGGAINTHRVTDIIVENGHYNFITKGDANYSEDKYPVGGKAVIGKVVFTSYVLGVIVKLLSNPIVFLPLIIIPFVIMIVLYVIKTIRLTKKIIEEEDRENALRIAEALNKRKAAIEQQKKLSQEELLEAQKLLEETECSQGEKRE